MRALNAAFNANRVHYQLHVDLIKLCFFYRWRRVASSQLDRHRTTYRAPRGSPKTFRSASTLKTSDSSNGCDCSQTGDTRGAIWIGGSSSDGMEGLWKNSTIAARSNRDRGAIEPRSTFFQRHHIAKRSEHDRWPTRTSIEARSRPDRDCSQTGDTRGAIWIGGSSSDGMEGLWKNSTIAARSNRDRGAIEPRSTFFQRHHIAKRSEHDRWPTRTSIVARSCEN